MTIEAATYIDQLEELYPEGVSGMSQGDNHLRLLKSVLKNTFPNLSAAVTATPAEMNRLVGLTSQAEERNRRGAVDGYCPLDADTLVPLANLPTNLTGKAAAKWISAITLALGGDAEGTVEIDGAGNVTLNVTNIAGTPSAHAHAVADVTDLPATLDTKVNLTDYIGSVILAKLLPVDGSGSGLDADLLDGEQGSSFLRRNLVAAQLVQGSPYCEEITLTDAATIAWDTTTGSEASVTLGGSRVLDITGTFPPAGTWLTLRVIQDGTGNRTLAYSADFAFGAFGQPPLSTGANKQDLLSFRSNGSKLQFTGFMEGF